jgi:hypothetical protein
VGNREARVVAALLVGLALVRGVLYCAVIPPWQAPDEFLHFEYAKLIAEKGRLVVTDADRSLPLQQAIIASLVKYDYWHVGYSLYPVDPVSPPQDFNAFLGYGGRSQLYQPPLYYALAALCLWPFRAQDMAVQLYAVRLFSVILGAVTVFLAFLTARELFPEDRFLIIGVPAFVALLPMHAFISASANPDNLAKVIGSLAIYVLVRGLHRGFSWAGVAGIALLIVAAWYTKRTVLFIVPLALIALLLSLWGQPLHSLLNRRRLAWFLVVLAAGVGSGFLLWWRLRGLWDRFAAQAAGYLILPKDLWRFLFDERHRGSEAQAFYQAAFQATFESFWARFGWMALRLDGLWYQLIALASLAALGGMVLSILRMARRPEMWTLGQRKGLLLLALAGIFAVGIIFLGMLQVQTFQPGALPQGRYLFPVIIPVATFFTLGWRELIPSGHRQAGLLAYMGAFALLDVLCLVSYIIPFFYLL